MFDKIRRRLIVGTLAAAALSASACGGTTSGGPGGESSSGEPKERIDVTSTSGVIVTASIAASTLGDGCPAGGAGYCQRSNMQLAFKAGVGTKNAVIEVVKVALIDVSNSSVLETLAVTSPAVWNGRLYTAWNQQVPPNGDLKASYDLASPDWSKIDGNNNTGTSSGGTSSRTSYSKNFKLHVTLRIDGVDVILESANLNRQPQSVT
jgi:hypothetical protein